MGSRNLYVHYSSSLFRIQHVTRTLRSLATVCGLLAYNTGTSIINLNSLSTTCPELYRLHDVNKTTKHILCLVELALIIWTPRTGSRLLQALYYSPSARGLCICVSHTVCSRFRFDSSVYTKGNELTIKRWYLLINL